MPHVFTSLLFHSTLSPCIEKMGTYPDDRKQGVVATSTVQSDTSSKKGKEREKEKGNKGNHQRRCQKIVSLKPLWLEISSRLPLLVGAML
jgi:hypothetical protein